MKKSKGITQVVAVTLLIGITVAAISSVYTIINDIEGEAKKTADRSFNPDNIEVGQCWQTGKELNAIIRNTGEEATYLEDPTVFIDGIPQQDVKLEEKSISPKTKTNISFELPSSSKLPDKEPVERVYKLSAGKSTKSFLGCRKIS